MKIKLSILCSVFITSAFAVTTFTSAGGASTNFNAAATWIESGDDDLDNIPDSDDDVVIDHNVIISGSNGACSNITVNAAGTIRFSTNNRLDVYGDYTLSGTEIRNAASSTANIRFSAGTGTLITINAGAAPAINLNYNVADSRTILTPATSLDKSGATISIGASQTLINQGTLTLGAVTANAGSTFTNDPNTSLFLKNSGFMSGRTFNAHSLGNLVTIQYTSGALPRPSAGFYNLILAGTVSGSKTLPAATIVLNDLTINSLNTLSASTFDLTVGGDWLNSGTFSPGTRTVTFNGTNQIIDRLIGTETFYRLTIAGSLTKTMGSAITASNNLTINLGSTLDVSASNYALNVGGNWSDAGTFTPRSGTVTFNGTNQNIAKTGGETFYRVVFAGTLTKTLGSAITTTNNLTINFNSTLDVSASNFAVNVAGNWSNAGTFTPRSGTVTFNGTNQSITNVGGETFYSVVFAGTLIKTLGAAITANGNLTINVLSSLDVSASDYAVNVKGNWLNNGTFVPQEGTVTFDGSAPQSLSGGTTTFENLTIDNLAGVSISTGTHSLTNTLTVNNGAFNTFGNSFTMISTALKTARIAALPLTASILGDFIVERFIGTRAADFADLSSPVQSAIFSDWDDELPAISYNFSNVPVRERPTQWTFNETTNKFVPLTAPGTALSPGQGFEVYLSGNFSYGALPDITVNTIGVPNQGDQSFGAPIVSFASAGENLVGNPFASAISWDAVLLASSGLDPNIDIWDNTAGNYASFGAGTIISATQGFWVYANAAPTLAIPEAAKVADPGNTQIRSTEAPSFFTLKLSGAEIPFSHVLKITANESSSNGWDINDHTFRKSPVEVAPDITTSIEGKKSAINSFYSGNENYSMPVSVHAGSDGNYTIEADGFDNIYEYTSVKLEDKFLNKTIDLKATNTYSFVSSSNDNPDRFVLHLCKDKNCTPAVKPTSHAAFNNEVSILPKKDGNTINFNFDESVLTTIYVTNVLGQNIMENITVNGFKQSLDINIPQDHHGIYIVRVESPKGIFTQKFIK